MVLLSLGGCAAPVGDGEAPSAAVEAAAPLLGAADGIDAADRQCRVVLREVHREAGTTGGPATSCTSGSCWFVWSGTFDQARELVDAGGTAGVLFRSSWSPEAWWEVGASPLDGAAAGFARFAFRLSEHTAAEGASFSALDRTRIELVPFVRQAGGGRLFDHNAHPGDFDNHVLTRDGGWSIAEDASVCRPAARATVVFRSGFTHEQHGAIVRGGKLTIDYAMARLPQCFGARYNGLSAFATLAYARFLPGGQLVSGSVKGAEDGMGGFLGQPLTLDVPRDAERVELWFFTSGRGCISAWDSNYGQNYGFAVVEAPPAPVAWAGGWGGSFARDCAHRDGLPDPIVLDGYVRERACSFVDADVYVPGSTDGAEVHPEHLLAEVEYTLDGGPPRRAWLGFVGRVGNDYRYRWELPRAEMTSAPWSEYRFAFLFSTDGASTYRIAGGGGPDGGEARRIQRGPTW